MEKKQIVFFCATTPYVMIYKIAREFKKRGYETILATFNKKESWEEEWYKGGFDKMFCSNFHLQKPNIKNSFNMLKRSPDLIKFLLEMKKLRPYVVFGVARPNLITSLALRLFKKYPFIYFPYDITAQQHANLEEALKSGIKKYEINAEKYCFENADGILHKGSLEELDFLKGKTILGENLKIPPIRINFQPYCSDEFIIPLNKNKLSKIDKEFHLVYVGGLYVTDEALNSYIKILNKLTAQKVHVHVYSKTQHLSKEDDIKNLGPVVKNFANNKYFHIEYALDPKKLIPEISKYDFGIDVANFRVDDPNYYLFSKFSTGNKIASFFEAGFPFFCNKKFEFECELLKKYKINLAFDATYDFSDFAERLKKIKYKEIEKKIIIAREDFNINKHFPRLEKFIEQVIEYHTDKFKK